MASDQQAVCPSYGSLFGQMLFLDAQAGLKSNEELQTTFVVLLVLLQGFNLGGFHLDSPVFNWVGTIVAAVVGLAAMVYRSLFGR